MRYLILCGLIFLFLPGIGQIEHGRTMNFSGDSIYIYKTDLTETDFYNIQSHRKRYHVVDSLMGHCQRPDSVINDSNKRTVLSRYKSGNYLFLIPREYSYLDEDTHEARFLTFNTSGRFIKSRIYVENNRPRFTRRKKYSSVGVSGGFMSNYGASLGLLVKRKISPRFFLFGHPMFTIGNKSEIFLQMGSVINFFPNHNTYPKRRKITPSLILGISPSINMMDSPRLNIYGITGLQVSAKLNKRVNLNLASQIMTPDLRNSYINVNIQLERLLAGTNCALRKFR